ncbi:phosphoenolpyruvate--protein phosphotransferase [Lentilactobacillus otakiensis]|uniref:Phosphoenolpyruvate-protein phosphotransferase n=1 Tax=Lentilactobacillus otakiensis DSM 19908 = JCM 15040 TaxID=1423780 RepID=S4PPY0_9LACO|nr:phosphoenolpyruvate--protein phosphotransferase [Lentilactobacillus otakiensis]KRL09665.1 phosphoenolpyruvate-protein phosphotransferase [Lentilactobacillus otakiensis DSM 19908 = JCM 15040]MBZ3777798.1 phosphoenolpyruvate--protein phosphotransferase [Lentilactobacillus otakiensis]MDV3518363.1 phosphoenolpyruvate--protein phosphotransferase [Lentilactobacillus otakiensis]GAD16750.1 phosphoenolpyruvate-protein phosphotransferase [Lentilactobacillus otakiensis DSM 19908 = JCM 15040]
MKEFKGIAASDGIAIASAFRLTEPDLSFKKRSITNASDEIKRLYAAIDVSKDELLTIQQRTLEDLGSSEAEVFKAHVAILSDPELLKRVKSTIEKEKVNAEYALNKVTDGYIKIFNSMTDNEYIRQRSSDIHDVTKRVLSHLLGVPLVDPALIHHQVIIIAHDLTPSDTAQFVPTYVKGIVSDMGGRTSHSAIMSRSLEIPAVVGFKGNLAEIKNGDTVIVDGSTGNIIVNPSDAQKDEYAQKQVDYRQRKTQLADFKYRETSSSDGKHPIIAANIGTLDDLDGAVENGAEGIGLFRTEFLYMDSNHLPTEDEQFNAYKTVLQKMGDKPVIIRTADIGGDKDLPYLDVPKEANPFLGYRAIRMSLDKLDIFRTQLRALLRASAFGNLSVMFPMVTTINELKKAKNILNQERIKLIRDKVRVKPIRIGIMVEVPATALLADQFANEVDFMSIGTNDLIQYVMAADRGNRMVSYLYQPYNPAVLRLIKNIIDACHDNNLPAYMCGEMAGDQTAIPVLVGMGLNEFSMSASSILKSRALIKRLDSREMVTLANKAVTMASTSEEVTAFIRQATNEIQ